jgi:hypothetical protein
MKKTRDLLDMYKSMKDRKNPGHATKVVPDKKKKEKNKKLKVVIQFDHSFDDITGGSGGE